jgi:hypothetical protein
MHARTVRVVWVLAAVSLFHAAWARAEMKVVELVVGPAANDAVYVLSPAGGSVAAGFMKGSRYVVAVDGVEGPKVDSVMMVMPQVGVVRPGDPRMGLPGYTPPPINQTPVVFSADGRRYAYLARLAQEYLVVVDGKEQRRFPVTAGAQVRMQFTGPEGKKFIMTVSNPQGMFDVWVDGEPKPPHDPNTVLILSRDGSRYAYAAAPDANDRNKRVLIVDGQPGGDATEDPMFTADSKHVLTLAQSGGERVLLVDGKPAVKAAGIPRVFLAPAGRKFVTVITRPGQGGQRYACVVDGKEVPATESTDQPFVAFSADGKRWAARCRNIVGAPVSWMVSDDGKKGQEYNGIADESIKFSPDGARLAYVASAGTKSFAIVDGQESDGFTYNASVGFSPDGKKAYYGGRRDGGATITRSLVVEGKEFKGDHNFNNESITFSPDGSRWAALGSGLKSGGPTGLQSVDNFLLDGQTLPGFTVASFWFAPGGRHVVFAGQRRSDNASGLFLDDGKPLILQSGRGRTPTFSPDGKHLYWTSVQQDPEANRPRHFVYADGKVVAKFDNVGLGNFEMNPGAWQIGADGTLSAVGVVGDNVVCYRVTPGDDTSVAGAAAALAAAEAKAVKDAQAAKDAAAQAAAKMKADQEAALKKRQEDAVKARQAAIEARQAAVAEQQRKRAEAAAAKKKAADEAAAAKKAKQPGK